MTWVVVVVTVDGGVDCVWGPFASEARARTIWREQIRRLSPSGAIGSPHLVATASEREQQPPA